MSTTTIRERAILFSGRLVRAILDGRKTQTRRVIRESLASDGIEDVIRAARPRQRDEYRFMWAEPDHEISLRPYAMPGDRLWVRETWRTLSGGSVRHPCEVQYQAGGFAERQPGLGEGTGRDVIARADGPGEATDFGKLRWRPSIFMPRWASRIDLEVVAVRVERLQEISEEDAIAEGVAPIGFYEELNRRERNCGLPSGIKMPPPLVQDFARGWDSINGKRAGASWAENPWCWCITFRRVRP